jgi:hypothetical protein
LSWPNVKIFMVFEGLTDPYFCPHPWLSDTFESIFQ